MKRLVIAIVLMAFCVGLAPAQEGSVVEEVIVKINDDIITLSEFNQRYDLGREQLATQFQGEELEQTSAQFKKLLFNILINLKLMEQRADKLGLQMSEEYYQRTVDFFRQQSGSRTEEEFQRAMADAGMTMEGIRELARRRYIQGALFQREILFQEEENIESKVQEYYEKNADRYRSPEEYRLSQMVFPYTAATKQTVAAQAAAALERLRAGEDFGEVYREVTPQAAPDANGDIGKVQPGSMREELSAAVAGKSAGEVTDLIELDTAFVILKVTEKQEARLIPLEEIQQQVVNDMQNERVAQGLEELILRYKQESFIEVKSDDFLALYDPKSTRREL